MLRYRLSDPRCCLASAIADTFSHRQHRKSTVGLALAKALGVPFIDGDDLHPADNVAKMSAGHPLTDEVTRRHVETGTTRSTADPHLDPVTAPSQDRIPWLHKVRETAVLLTSPAGLAALDHPAVPETVDEAQDRAVEHELHAALQRINPESLAARLERRSGEKGQKRQREAVVVACSALTVQYRNLLRGEEARFQLPDGREIVTEKKLEPHIETFFVYCERLAGHQSAAREPLPLAFRSRG